MDLKKKFLILYVLIGLEGIIFVELQNVFIVGSSWEQIVKYNLPFVALQNVIFVSVYYVFTNRYLKPLLQVQENDFDTLSISERTHLFDTLVNFPFVMFRFSLLFFISLASAFHVYEAILVDRITKEFAIGVLVSFLREQSLGMILIITMIAFSTKMLRPYIIKLKQPSIEKIRLSLGRKIHLVFFSLLFIFITDISWVFFNTNGTDEMIVFKMSIVVAVLVALSLVSIRLTIMDSIIYIQDVATYIAGVKSQDREALHSEIPVTSNDEIGYLIGHFNELQFKTQGLYKEIDEELKLAFTVQEKLVPRASHVFDEFFVEGVSIPVKEVGGDFFDIIEIDDRKLGILIGDVSGNGLPAALFMSVMVGLVRGKMNPGTLSPARLLEQFNQLLVPLLSEGMYVTAGLALIDMEKRILTYASAGHVSPMIKENEQTRLLELSSLPLGIDETETYDEIEIAVDSLQAIWFYTDGIVEQWNNENEMFGFHRLTQRFENNWQADVESVIAEVIQFSEGTNRMDDMTVVNVRKMLE